MTSTTTPVTCTCDVPVFFDVVTHREECALLLHMEALIAGTMLAPGDVKDAGDPVFVITPSGRFVCLPGVDGDTRCAM
jgi:hypothetical protein